MNNQVVTVDSALASDSGRLAKACQRLAAKAQDGIMRPIVAAASKVVAEAERSAAPAKAA